MNPPLTAAPRAWFVNTDASSNGGLSYDEAWFARSCIATSGGPQYRRQCQLISRGDIVLVYVNGVGVVAGGVVLDDQPVDVAPPRCLSPNEELEFHRQVSWFADLRGKPLTRALIEQLRGAGPTRAVTRLDKGAAAVLQAIDEQTGGGILRDQLQISVLHKAGSTTRQRLMDARVGQGKFREDVLARWDHRCAVTGTTVLEAVRASHVLPWAGATDDERLDPDNGLPLTATLDALFDRGLIGFDASGALLVSSQLVSDQRFLLNGARGLRRPPNVQLAKFLAYHRAKLMAPRGNMDVLS